MTEAMVVEVPQWQGSSSATAHRLRDGAARLAALVPAAARRRVPTGDTLTETARRVRTALAETAGRFVVTVGGDCGVDLEPIADAVRRYGERLAVVWFDAHADLNTPASSPSGAFHGMVARTLLGDGLPELVPERALKPSRLVLAGVRALDPPEEEYIRAAGVPRVGPDALDGLVAAVAGTGAEAVYVHVDLDVLDPGVFPSVGAPVPGGLRPAQLLAQVTALAERFEIVGLGVTEYEPARPEDDDLLAGLLPGLVRACRTSLAGGLDRRSALAWRGAVLEDHDGWLLRHAPGLTGRRVNSALPPLRRCSPADLDRVERFYRERDTPIAVQVSPAEHHRDLDALLAARGYRFDSPVAVLTAATRTVAATAAPSLPVEVTGHAAPWLPAFAALYGRADSARIGEEVISRIASPAAYLSLHQDGRPVGIGLVVADTGWAGVFCMATHPGHRRRGVAAAVLRTGARWAADRGIDRLYLQVETANEPALRLYTRAGFTRSHGYHYRLRP